MKKLMNLQKHMPKIDIVLILISKPIIIGIYENNSLIKELRTDEKSSDFIPNFFESILKEYKINNVVFTNSPGSFLAIKSTYVFLKTLSFAINISLYGVDGFYFNEKSPIKSMGKLYFVKEKDIIITKILNNPLIKEFSLKKFFSIKDFTKDINPKYLIPYV